MQNTLTPDQSNQCLPGSIFQPNCLPMLLYANSVYASLNMPLSENHENKFYNEPLPLTEEKYTYLESIRSQLMPAVR